MIIAPLGIPNILFRELVKRPLEKFDLIGSTIGLRLISASILYLLMLIIAFILNYSPLEITLISIFGWVMFGQVFDTIDVYLQSLIKLKSSSKIRIIGLILGSVAKLLLIYFKAPLIAFAIVFTAEYLVIALGFVIIYGKYGHTIKELKWNPNIIKPLLITSLPLLYYAALTTINMKIDQLMISEMLDNTANGYYSAVVGLIEATYFIPVALGTSIFPGLVKQKEVNLTEYNNTFQLLYEILLVISIAIALVFFIGAPIIIKLLFGAEFSPSIPIMQMYAFCPILIFYGSIRNRWLIIQDLHKYSIYFLIASIIVNVALNIMLLPVIGPIGAVIAILISYFVAFIVMPFIIPETRPSVNTFFGAMLFPQIRKMIKNKKL